jgi:hypothetical protein
LLRQFHCRFLCPIALVIFLFSGSARAEDPNTLPSRKASVVMPLLNQISSKDSPQNVLDRIKKILGETDGGVDGGGIGRFWSSDDYLLDDNTVISVSYLNGKLDGITIRSPGQAWKILYTPPKPPINST